MDIIHGWMDGAESGAFTEFLACAGGYIKE
jgi:hypothetical protein